MSKQSETLMALAAVLGGAPLGVLGVSAKRPKVQKPFTEIDKLAMAKAQEKRARKAEKRSKGE